MLLQTVKTLIRRRLMRRLIWVYTVCQCPFSGTLGINGLTYKVSKAISVCEWFGRIYTLTESTKIDSFLLYNQIIGFGRICCCIQKSLIGPHGMHSLAEISLAARDIR